MNFGHETRQEIDYPQVDDVMTHSRFLAVADVPLH